MTKLIRRTYRQSNPYTSTSSVSLTCKEGHGLVYHATPNIRSSPIDPTSHAPPQIQSALLPFPQHNNDYNLSSGVRRTPIEPQSPLCTSFHSPVFQFPQRHIENGENHYQDRRPSSGYALLLPRVLPPQNPHGLLELARASRQDVALPTPPLRDRYLGRRRLNSRQEHGARGVVSTGAGPHDLLALDLYEYEAGRG